MSVRHKDVKDRPAVNHFVPQYKKKPELPLIFFSGGLESTWILHRQLINGPCDIITVEHSFNCPSMLAEKLARSKILDYFKMHPETYPHQVKDHLRITTKHASGPEHDRLGYQQLHYLTEYAWQYVDPDRHTKVILGNCMTDDSASIHDKLVQYWDLRWQVFVATAQHRYPELELPLARMSKSYVMTWAKHEAKDLLKLISWCSYPTYGTRGKVTPCGICISCMDHAFALKITLENHRRDIQMRKSSDQLEQLIEIQQRRDRKDFKAYERRQRREQLAKMMDDPEVHDG